jgi:hypothetical protein
MDNDNNKPQIGYTEGETLVMMIWEAWSRTCAYCNASV